LITICLVSFSCLVFPASKFILCGFWSGKPASLWISPSQRLSMKVLNSSDNLPPGALL
jgi:hypothetical protein